MDKFTPATTYVHGLNFAISGLLGYWCGLSLKVLVVLTILTGIAWAASLRLTIAHNAERKRWDRVYQQALYIRDDLNIWPEEEHATKQALS